MGFYEQLKELKARGATIHIDDLTPKELKQLYIDEQKTDKQLAELFDVKKSKVTYRRRKHGITIRNSILDEYLFGTSEKARALNEQTKDNIFKFENINMISKAITHFAFRNGPV